MDERKCDEYCNLNGAMGAKDNRFKFYEVNREDLVRK